MKLIKTTLDTTLASQTTLTFAEMDTLFCSVADTVNQRPIAVKSFTDDDIHAITPNDLLLGRSRNTVPGATFSSGESVTRRQETMQEIEQLWWSQWLTQALPHLVPFRKWKVEHRNLQPGDVVMVLYDRKLGKGQYKLGRVLRTHPDPHGRVRTVTVGVRARGKDNDLPYIPKPLDEHKLGVQRVAVICPIEEQVVGADGSLGGDSSSE